MSDNPFKLMTAVEAEDELGQKYFYRQKTYRYLKAGKLKAFSFRGQQCFLPHKILEVYLNELKAKVMTIAPELINIKIFFDDITKRMVIDGIHGRYIAVYTDKETEEGLIDKLKAVKEWLVAENEPNIESVSIDLVDTINISEDIENDVDKPVTQSVSNSVPSDVFPSEIQFIKVELNNIEGVEVKSSVLISLPSVSQFIGVRSDHMAEWVQKTTFSDFVVSAHPRQIHGTGISGPWNRGFVKGATALIPLELIPELLVAFKQSGRTPQFPAKAEQLYMLAQSTLEAVGLAISGNKDIAASELAKVSEGLGINAADQVIEIFKRYESRPFQVETHSKFSSKISKNRQDYRTVTGTITLGVTGRYPGAWLALGASRKLPSKNRTSGREVMRTLDPASSVGMTFSESHYIKNSSNMEEVIKTGKQGKDFYKRLKDVGLLDN